MDILIVEDEQLLAMELAEKLIRLDENIKVVGQTDSVGSTIDWLNRHTCDLIFLDVHLNDGNSFSIFEKIKVDCPIIFTTAYDKYAIKAFELNSIGYLLKPIDDDELRKAIDKYKMLNATPKVDMKKLLAYFNNQSADKNKNLKRIMLTYGQKQMALNIEDIAYFMADGRYLYAISRDGKKYFSEYTLSRLEEELDTQNFFRLNRQFIVSFDSVDYFIKYSKSRVKVKLTPDLGEDVIISSEKVKEFKAWLVR